LKHGDEWLRESLDPQKREHRIKNLVELFKICELLKHVVIDQINMPTASEEPSSVVQYSERRENGTYTSSTTLEVNGATAATVAQEGGGSPCKKKKKKVKKERTDEMEPLRVEAQRLAKVPNSEKAYFFKPEANGVTS
jgi:hypothetical protein